MIQLIAIIRSHRPIAGALAALALALSLGRIWEHWQASAYSGSAVDASLYPAGGIVLPFLDITDLEHPYPETHWPDSWKHTARQASVREARSAVIERDLSLQRAALPVELEMRSSAEVQAKFSELLLDHYESRLSLTEVREGMVFSKGHVRWVSELTKPRRDKLVRGIAHFQSELAGLGIDLIVTIVPNKLDTYAFLFTDRVGDTSICPEHTKLLLELMQEGIEILDLRKDFRTAAGTGRQLLFHQYDHHWAPAGMDIAGKRLAERLQRYEFVRDAAAHRAEFGSKAILYKRPDNRRDMLPDWDQFERGTMLGEQILFRGELVRNDPGSPLLVMGDSNVRQLEEVSMGIRAHLAREIGLPICSFGRGMGLPLVAADFRDHFLESPPAVVALVLIGSLLPEPEWQLVKLQGEPEDGGEGERLVRITGCPAVSDPKQSPYKDALCVYEGELLPEKAEARGETGTDASRSARVHIVTWAYQDRKRSAHLLEAGAVYRLELAGFAEAQKKDARLKSARIFDDSRNYDAQRFWWEPKQPVLLQAAASPTARPTVKRN